jgi:hypothetical protein
VAVNGKNMIMIFDHKDVSMYVVEFRTLGAPASGRLDMETDYVATADAVGGRVDRQSIFRRGIRADAPNRRVVDLRAGRERGEVRHRVRSPARTIWRSLRASTRIHAIRVAMKAFLKDLWCEWQRAHALQQAAE